MYVILYPVVQDKVNSHVSEIRSTKGCLHSEAVGDTQLTPHDNTSCGFFTLANDELAPLERELIGGLEYKIPESG